MLALAPSAVEVVNTMAEQYGASNTAGLRIANAGDSPVTEGLEVAFVPGPGDNDQVVTEGGARVYLESEAATYLADMVLSGGLDDQGQVRFELAQQNYRDGSVAP
jgi:Fe-S cluster assembly iron-binding protein IscA